MKLSILKTLLILLTVSVSHAHISYVSRDLGSFNPIVASSVTLSSNTVSSDFGWASGTDANGGDSHKLRAFKFSVSSAGAVTFRAQGLSFDRSGVPIGALALPAFSVYRGLAHESPALGDHDSSVISALYNDSVYGAGNWQGSFRALGDWKIGNDDGATFADLSSFTYLGHAVDGESSDLGGGVDGMVVQTLNLDPGSYSIFVGGGRYYDLLNTGGDSSSFGFLLTVSTIPEPSTGSLLGICFLLWMLKNNAAGTVAMSLCHRKKRKGLF